MHPWLVWLGYECFLGLLRHHGIAEVGDECGDVVEVDFVIAVVIGGKVVLLDKPYE